MGRKMAPVGIPPLANTEVFFSRTPVCLSPLLRLKTRLCPVCSANPRSFPAPSKSPAREPTFEAPCSVSRNMPVAFPINSASSPPACRSISGPTNIFTAQTGQAILEPSGTQTDALAYPLPGRKYKNAERTPCQLFLTLLPWARFCCPAVLSCPLSPAAGHRRAVSQTI